MGFLEEKAVRDLKNGEAFFVPVCKSSPTVPFVICDKESYNDQVWLFSKKEDAEAFCRKRLETDKDNLVLVRVEKKGFVSYFNTLHTLGVNAVVWNDGEEQTEVELDDVQPAPDYSTREEAKRPLMNPTLQISAIYYLQELRRYKDPKMSKELPMLWQEVLANIVKSRYLVVGQMVQKDGNNNLVPLLMNVKTGGKEEKLLPVFSDQMEYERYVISSKLLLNKNFRPAILQMPFGNIANMLNDQVPRFVINPMGVGLHISRDLVKALQKPANPQ